MELPKRCFLTGHLYNKDFEFAPRTALFLEYKYAPVGKVKVALSLLIAFNNKQEFKHPLLAGICRNAFELGEDTPLIDQTFMDVGIKNISYPKSFHEKARHLLNFMYHKGGKNLIPFTFLGVRDYPLCFSDDLGEFDRVMDYLQGNHFIKWGRLDTLSSGKRYSDVLLSDLGIKEVEKDMPKIPMIGLVDQKITTGDKETDEKINHAKELFFREPQTLDRMRSACEALSHVLEPLRKNLEQYFTTKDISDFFQIVNAFDIRHNKDNTKEIQHPEQFEWVFYTLLNTINTYTKLKHRLK